MTEEIERELQDLREQLLLLQVENVKTRNGWLNWMRNTGFLLLVFGITIFSGILQSHHSPESNPIVATFGVMAIFMLVLGAWTALWSLRPLAERLMKLG
jgi:Na+/melibiose symporter-like transporter